jgi:hypothetical protein
MNDRFLCAMRLWMLVRRMFPKQGRLHSALMSSHLRCARQPSARQSPQHVADAGCAARPCQRGEPRRCHAASEVRSCSGVRRFSSWTIMRVPCNAQERPAAWGSWPRRRGGREHAGAPRESWLDGPAHAWQAGRRHGGPHQRPCVTRGWPRRARLGARPAQGRQSATPASRVRSGPRARRTRAAWTGPAPGREAHRGPSPWAWGSPALAGATRRRAAAQPRPGSTRGCTTITEARRTAGSVGAGLA